ncbi:MAG: tetratricopeptide repeat protein [Bradymonadaceae bacterium]
MAITPRTIFSSAAPATVAAVSLLAFTAVGTVAYMSSQQQGPTTHRTVTHPSSARATCQNVRQALGADQAKWSERDWIHYTACFDQKNASEQAVQTASNGLEFYPRSEPLYNMKGYHQIVLDRHIEAIETLETGLQRVDRPRSGVLENNLAWAALWAPREMDLDRARQLYRSALDKKSNVCAYLHTGLWVEYAKAREASGVDRFEALRQFDKLRDRYEPCLSRLGNGEWKTVVEIAGAAALFSEVDGQNAGNATDQTSGDKLLKKTARLLQRRYSDKSVESICREAMPVSTTHHVCTEHLTNAMSKVSNGTIKTTDADSAAAGSGGAPCPMRK